MSDYLSPGMLAAALLVGGSAFAGENDTGNSPSQPVAENIEITETRLPSGDSEVHVSTGPDRPATVYRIRLTPHHHPATSPQDPAIKRWASWKYGAFLCFNSNQFTGQEHCRAKDPKMFAPDHLDVSQWISTFKAAGMRYAVLTARHTSGFLLWDSLTSRHDVAASGNRTDLVRVYVEECRRQGVAAGLYYCRGGRKRSSCGFGSEKEHSGRLAWGPRVLKPGEICFRSHESRESASLLSRMHRQQWLLVNYQPILGLSSDHWAHSCSNCVRRSNDAG